MSFHCTLFRSLVFSIRVSSGSTEWMLHFINSPCLNESLTIRCGVFADSPATCFKAGGNVIETHEHKLSFCLTPFLSQLEQAGICFGIFLLFLYPFSSFGVTKMSPHFLGIRGFIHFGLFLIWFYFGFVKS